LCPFVVEWPTSKALYDIGFKDSYRTIYPNEVTEHGITWSLAKEDEGKRFDRIDYIYFKNIEVEKVVVIDNKVSDHSAVMATFILN